MNDKEFKEWEKQVEATKKHNEKLLLEFQQWLETKSLKPKTIETHVENMRFYANEFLIRYDMGTIEQGALEIDGFLADYLIAKTTWGSKSSIRENIAGFKKLYTFLCERGHTSKSDLQEMKDLIKTEKSDWLDAVDDYWDNMRDSW